jgi:hypothetical protein
MLILINVNNCMEYEILQIIIINMFKLNKLLSDGEEKGKGETNELYI